MPQPNNKGMEPSFGDSFRSCYLYSSLEQTISSPERRFDSDFLYGQERPPGCRPGSGDELMSLASLCRRRRPAGGLVELLSDLVDDEPPCYLTSRSRERWDVSALEDFTRSSKAEPAGDPGRIGSRSLEDVGGRPEEILSLLDIQTGDTDLLTQPPGHPTPTPPHTSPSPHTSPAPYASPTPLPSPAPYTNPTPNASPAHHTSPAPYTSPASYSSPTPYTPSASPAHHTNSTPYTSPTYFTSPTPDTSPAPLTHPAPLTSPAPLTRCSLEPGAGLQSKEHNYSLFGLSPPPVDTDDQSERSEMESGSDTEYEASQSEEEEEEEEGGEDREDFSDYLSETGNEQELSAGTEAGVRQCKRRFFWEYSDSHATPSKQRLLLPYEWDCNTLPSNVYCKEQGIGQGRRSGKKSRRSDVDDLTPNPRKLLHIGEELSKLNQVITELPTISELPLNARPCSRKEKNKLASRACRLKKKAQHEANKIKLWGLNNEHDHLLQVVVAVKQQIVRRVQRGDEELEPESLSSTQRLAQLVDTLGSPVAGHTSEFVAKVLANVGAGKPPERAGWPLVSAT